MNTNEEWVLVPVHPTDDMIAAAEEVEDLYKRGTPQTWATVYRRMIAEAPAHVEPKVSPACERTAVHQWRKAGSGCPEWMDGHPDPTDGAGPYETRTLYTAPVRAQTLSEMTEEQIEVVIDARVAMEVAERAIDIKSRPLVIGPDDIHAQSRLKDLATPMRAPYQPLSDAKKAAKFERLKSEVEEFIAAHESSTSHYLYDAEIIDRFRYEKKKHVKRAIKELR